MGGRLWHAAVDWSVMPPAERTNKRRQPFEVEKTDLEQLEIILCSYDLSLTWTLQVSDGTSLRYSSLAELLSFENPPERRMQALFVSGTSTTEAAGIQSATIELDAHSGTKETNVIWTLRGSDDIVFLLTHKLTSWRNQIRSSSATLTEMRELIASAALFLLTMGTLSILENKLPGFASFFSGAFRWFFISILTSAALLLPYVAQRPLNYLFPFSSFAIGHGIKRLEGQKKGPHGLDVGSGRGGASVIPPQQ